MNIILSKFNSMSDSDIINAILEIETAEKTGIFSENSIIRQLAKECGEITGMDISSNLLMVQMNILKQGAFRWVKLTLEKQY